MHDEHRLGSNRASCVAVGAKFSARSLKSACNLLMNLFVLADGLEWFAGARELQSSEATVSRKSALKTTKL